VKSMCDKPRGLILVTGPTGSGKSTTLAAMLDKINSERDEHMITIEDPIEFLHNHQKATIHQRELHSDTPTFALGLRAALRQSPKVILVGELRDRETMEMLLEAAETGHLVLSALNAPNALKTLERIETAFPASEQSWLRGRLAKTLRYVISQRLIPRKDGGRVAILEVFKNTPRTVQCLQAQDPSGSALLEAIKSGASEGMQHFDGEIAKLVRAGVVDLATVSSYASDPQQLQNTLSQ
jgi:twitching motility protein PilT